MRTEVLGGLLALLLCVAPLRAQTLSARPSQAAVEDDPDADPPVSEADLKVVARARQLLSSPAIWNKQDNRKCPDAETSFSLYCAVEVATKEVEGSFAHRGAAMQQARFVVDDVTSKRDYKHRLRDYNNDPATSFADITHIFDLMDARIRAKLATRSGARSTR